MADRNFVEMGLVGADLKFVKDPSETVEVISARHVLYRGEKRFLGSVTKQLLNDDTLDRDHTKYWTCEGRCVREIYEETASKH